MRGGLNGDLFGVFLGEIPKRSRLVQLGRRSAYGGSSETDDDGCL